VGYEIFVSSQVLIAHHANQLQGKQANIVNSGLN